MKFTEKNLSETEIQDVLELCGFEVDGGNHYWNLPYECYVDVKLEGQKLYHVLKWVRDFIANQEKNYGYNNGKSEIVNGIKKLLEI